jgi:hypothetical protein
MTEGQRLHLYLQTTLPDTLFTIFTTLAYRFQRT